MLTVSLSLKTGKFVEHGQFEKNYYGTSLSAIEAVVQSGKICVLNMHVQSIPILRQGHAGELLFHHCLSKTVQGISSQHHRTHQQQTHQSTSILRVKETTHRGFIALPWKKIDNLAD